MSTNHAQELINSVRANKADVVNVDGVMKLRGHVPPEILAILKENKPTLLEHLSPVGRDIVSKVFGRVSCTVSAPTDDACVDCGRITVTMMKLGDDFLCELCRPGAQSKPQHCRWCGLRLVPRESHYVASRKSYYCSKQTCYKEEAKWLKENNLTKKRTPRNGISANESVSETQSESGLPSSAQGSTKKTRSGSPGPLKTESFDRVGAGKALSDRRHGLEICGDAVREGERWIVPVCTSVTRVPIGHRSIFQTSKGWSVEPGTYQHGQWFPYRHDELTAAEDGEKDPLGGGSWER